MAKKTDGRKPKFRILCMKCHSYIYTSSTLSVSFARTRTEDEMCSIDIVCTQCGNFANSFEEE